MAQLEAQLAVAASLPAGGSSRLGALASAGGAGAPVGQAASLSARWLPGGSLSLAPSGALRYVDSTSSFFRTNPTDRACPPPDRPPALPAAALDFRYLPIPLARDLHDEVLDLAFSRMLSHGCFAREAPFRRHLAAAPLVRTNAFSPFLHLAVLAVGCRYLPAERWPAVCPFGEALADRGQVFARAAKQLVEDEAERPNLAFLRGLLTLSAFMVGTGQE